MPFSAPDVARRSNVSMRAPTVRHLPYLLAMIVLLAPWPADADQRDSGIVTLQIENDSVARTDRNYTSGLRLSYLSPEVAVDDLTQRIARNLPVVDLGENLRFGVALGQSLFTPRDVKERELIVDDRPYAGWLYLGFSLVGYRDTEPEAGKLGQVGMIQSLTLDVGMIGPAALGRPVQNEFHRLIGARITRGWRNQLHNELAFMLSYERQWRQWSADDINLGLGRFDLDLMPHIGASLGTVMTAASAGATVRFGQGITRDFGPPRIRPSVPGSGHFRRGDVAWYLFAGAQGRAVARDIFLDGNTFRSSHSIPKNHFVGDIQAGIALNLADVRLSYTHVYRTAESPLLGPHRFGAVTVSWRLTL